jgi:putative ABC transport system permease protein
MGMNVFSEMLDNQELLDQQYDVIAGNWPTAYNEVVLVVTSNNQISKMTLYMLGVLDQSELEDIIEDLMLNGEYDTTPMEPYELEDFLGMRFKLLNTSQFFEPTGKKYVVDGVEYPEWYDMREAGLDQESFVKANGIDLEICGIVRPRKGVAATSITGAIGYTKELTEHILAMNAESEIIHQQKNLTPNHNVLNGDPFERTPYTRENIADLIDRVGSTNMERFYSVVTRMLREEPRTPFSM